MTYIIILNWASCSHSWPVPIPPGTSVPSWAFADVTIPDTFQPSSAQAIAATNPAESSPAAAPPTSISFTPSASAYDQLPPAAPSNGSDNSSSSSSHHSNTGPIVGGVVGGLGGAAILAGVIAYFCIRHRRKQAAAGGVGTTLAGSDPGQPDMYQHQGVGYTGVPPHSPMSPPSSSAPLYNPDDPSTFPGVGGAQSGSGYAPSQYTGPSQHTGASQYTGPSQQSSGRYTGVAEV